MTIDTVCHNPAHRLHGLVLEDYNNSKCEMKEIKGMGSQFFICSCSEDECNEHIFFTSSKSRPFYFLPTFEFSKFIYVFFRQSHDCIQIHVGSIRNCFHSLALILCVSNHSLVST